MDTNLLLIIAAVAAAVLAAVAWAVVAWRRRRLRDEFGPEYERVVEHATSKRAARSELEERRERRQHLDVRPLPEAARTRYRERWRAAQADFVDAPASAVQQADTIILEVMREHGYPVEDFEQRAADLSVDHPDVVQHYRESHETVQRYTGNGHGNTEDLRQAMLHLRRCSRSSWRLRTSPTPCLRGNGYDPLEEHDASGVGPETARSPTAEVGLRSTGRNGGVCAAPGPASRRSVYPGR